MMLYHIYFIYYYHFIGMKFFIIAKLIFKSFTYAFTYIIILINVIFNSNILFIFSISKLCNIDVLITMELRMMFYHKYYIYYYHFNGMKFFYNTILIFKSFYLCFYLYNCYVN